jgi:hypothetical protein
MDSSILCDNSFQLAPGIFGCCNAVVFAAYLAIKLKNITDSPTSCVIKIARRQTHIVENAVGFP